MISTLPAKILEERDEGNNRIGLVESDGKRREIYLSLVPEARVGDYVRYHAGFATERVDTGEAQRAYQQVGRGQEYERLADFETGQAYRLLSELDPQQLRKLLPIAQDAQFNAGQVIFRAGDKSLFLHLIVAGDVALEDLSGDQPGVHPVHVQTLHAGDATGWSALTPDARTRFQARALSNVSTVAFPGDQLRNACDEDPAMGYALMKRLMELVTERLDVLRMKLARRGETELR
jgi:CRP/FNR family transcriptional regulator, cyclic AMP receptor protein